MASEVSGSYRGDIQHICIPEFIGHNCSPVLAAVSELISEHCLDQVETVTTLAWKGSLLGTKS